MTILSPASRPADPLLPTLTPEVASRFLSALWQLNRQVKHDVEPQIAEQQLDLRRFFLLTAIGRGVVYPKELSKKLEISATLLSRYLDQVVQLGYVERQIDSQDSRRTVLSLTELGDAATQRALQSIYATTNHRLHRLDSEKLSTMLEVMELLIAPEPQGPDQKPPTHIKEKY